MDLQERRQLDVAARMDSVRRRTRPWRSIIALAVAIAVAVAAELWGQNGALAKSAHLSSETQRVITFVGVATFFVFGMAAALGLSGKARSTLQPLIGQAHAGVVRYVLVVAGVFAVLTVTLAIGGVSPRQLVIGGAVTGVLLGIAAQQSLANLFAGLVLLFASPFRVGDHVRFRAGALSGEIEGTVTDLSLTYVRLETQQGRVLLPNAQALGAAVLLIADRADSAAPEPGIDAGPGGGASAGPAPGSPAADGPAG